MISIIIARNYPRPKYTRDKLYSGNKVDAYLYGKGKRKSQINSTA